ncbi:MAG TPA: glycoside hydrolase family 15 protein [Candidatus Peribacteria bacterium]|nr:glycoside hydrolase family 15 protein [Candidatus Peribacteria bacterium]
MQEYQPISSYGFIGNLGTCALVNINGSIDWCCMPYLDSPSAFAAMLDPDRGGSFSIRPVDPIKHVEQAYAADTNILRTTFTTDAGKIVLTDWMHMGPFSHEERECHRLPLLFRLAECTEGTVQIDVVFDPRPDYAQAARTLSVETDGVIVAESGGDRISLKSTGALRLGDAAARGVVTLNRGQEWSCACAYGAVLADAPDVRQSLAETEAYWRTWVSHCQDGACRYVPTWRDPVVRSALTLKILAGGPTGIAAAATTSLPEIIGGSDNWDYRFNWIRDSSFTIQALAALGHVHDAQDFIGWLCKLLVQDGRRPADLKVLYPLHGSVAPVERELPHLRGYRDSRPVRIGNGAIDQRQIDIYGEILEAVYRSSFLQPGVDTALAGMLRNIVDYVCDIWREPDWGIWETRVDPGHHTYSKVMCWVALDRGIRMAEAHGWAADLARWRTERDAIHALVLAKGFNHRIGSFTQSFDSEVLDATALLFPLLEFLPPDHPYSLGTLTVLQRELAKGPLVYRTSNHSGKEGAFGFCSFWLVNALALAGRADEAHENFVQLLGMANHVGLYSEEIDPVSGAFLGNFPQAFTHVGLINSALYLARTQGILAAHPLMGESRSPTEPSDQNGSSNDAAGTLGQD